MTPIPEIVRGEMLSTMRRLFRMLVDRLAETKWLRDKAGANSMWWHYEQHARASRKAAERHAAARVKARRRAERLHGRSASRTRRHHGRDVN